MIPSLATHPAHKLFDLVHAEHNEGVIAPRAYTDYTITVDEANLPAGVTCKVLG